jgi:hypothetical protein
MTQTVRYEDRLLPSWALEELGPGDRRRADQARLDGQLRVDWESRRALRRWAKAHDWPAPLFGLEAVLLDRFLAREEDFDTAAGSDEIRFRAPVLEHSVSSAELSGMDAEYVDSASWGSLVAGLRSIRRAVESGVVVDVEGRKLDSWNDFYTWAHERYRSLEDGHDAWIGDDRG